MVVRVLHKVVVLLPTDERVVLSAVALPLRYQVLDPVRHLPIALLELGAEDLARVYELGTLLEHVLGVLKGEEDDDKRGEPQVRKEPPSLAMGVAVAVLAMAVAAAAAAIAAMAAMTDEAMAAMMRRWAAAAQTLRERVPHSTEATGALLWWWRRRSSGGWW